MLDRNSETNKLLFELFPSLKEFFNGKHGMTVVLVEQNVEFARCASHRFVTYGSGRRRGTRIRQRTVGRPRSPACGRLDRRMAVTFKEPINQLGVCHVPR